MKSFTGGPVKKKVEKLRRMKASNSMFHANSNALDEYRQFVAFSADSIH
jgi:hypothetical protein